MALCLSQNTATGWHGGLPPSFVILILSPGQSIMGIPHCIITTFPHATNGLKTWGDVLRPFQLNFTHVLMEKN